VFYDHRRAAGDTHQQTLRALGSRLVGFLHGCLAARTPTTRQPRGTAALGALGWSRQRRKPLTAAPASG
jgi:hypothetical protein